MAIGTSDGEYYPSSLENVLAGLTTSGSTKEPKNSAMDVLREDNENPTPQPRPTAPPHGVEIASTGPDAINPVNQDRVDTTKAYDQLRDRNDLPGAPYQDIRRKTRVAQAGSYIPDGVLSEKDLNDFFAKPIIPGAPAWVGKGYTDSLPKLLDSAPDGFLVDKNHPGIKNLPNDIEILDNEHPAAKDSIFIRRRIDNPRTSEADIPKNAQPAQYLIGLSNQDAANKNMKLSSEEKNLYDTHLKNLIGSGGVDNEDGSRSSLKALTVSGTGDNADKTYIVPTVVDGKLLDPKEAVARADKMGLDKFPSYSSQEEADKRYSQLHDYMEKDTQNYQSVRNTYNKVTDFLDNLSDMKGAESWSPREIIGHALATGMNALGIEAPKGFALKSPGVRIEPVSPKAPANENVKMSLREQLDKAGIKSMSVDEYKQYQADRKLNPSESDKELAKIQQAAAEWAKDHPPTSSYERALENQKAGRTNPTGDTADDLIKGLRSGKPNIKLVTENPTQEPQGRPIPGEQARTQEAQRAANDRNYTMGKGRDRVNVGQGKGVLNDNKEEVQAMIRKGHRPSEIAERFDITPLAVRNWIKRNGSINTIDAILK